MRQAHVFISGFVQEVGFRAYIANQAKRLGLNGWVRNMSDGRVEAVFQPSLSQWPHEEEKIQEMIDFCHKGPFLAEIEEVVVEWEEMEEVFEDFEIL